MYYVYGGWVNGALVYIGRGTKRRLGHLNSGVSSVYQANKLHFEGGAVDVRIIQEFSDAAECAKAEVKLIADRQPAWNIEGTRKRKKSNYLGVSPSRYSKKNPWIARVKIPGTKSNIHVGVFPTEFEAAMARDLYVIEHGYEMPLNFD